MFLGVSYIHMLPELVFISGMLVNGVLGAVEIGLDDDQRVDVFWKIFT